MKQILSLITAVLLLCSVLTACAPTEPNTNTEESLPNPMVEYKSLGEVNQQMDFPMTELPIDLPYQLTQLFIIDQTLVQLNYTDAAQEAEILVRKAEGEENISGVGQIDYTQELVAGLSVNIGTFEKTWVAWFVKEDFSYALLATDVDGSAFDTLLLSYVKEVQKEMDDEADGATEEVAE